MASIPRTDAGNPDSPIVLCLIIVPIEPKNKASRSFITGSFSDTMLNLVLDNSHLTLGDEFEVSGASSDNGPWTKIADLDVSVGPLVSFFGIKYVKVSLNETKKPDDSETKMCAFETLMAASAVRTLPKHKTSRYSVK